MSGSASGGGGSRGTAAAGRNAETDLAEASEEDLRLVRSVCQMVVRQFYSDQHIKDLLMMANQLVRDRLIGIHKRSETRETATATSVFTRAAIRNYFYIDRKVFLDVTKWRMMKMRSQIDSVLRNELDNKGYMCPRCGKSYSTLDVASLLDPMTSLSFICDVPGCGSELVDNEDAEDVKRSKDRLKRFNEQCGPILDRLRKIDKVILPSFDVLREINRSGDSDAWKLRARQRIDPNATMKDIREAQGDAVPSASMEVTMVSNDPAVEAARRAQREREAEQQRQENALPQWWRTTQDPNATRPASTAADGGGKINGNAAIPQRAGSGDVQDDYYARYASMAQAGDEEEDEMGLEDVNSATPSAGPSVSHTPSAAGKRSREDSYDVEGAHKKSRADEEGEEEEEEEEIDFEEVV